MSVFDIRCHVGIWWLFVWTFQHVIKDNINASKRGHHYTEETNNSTRQAKNTLEKVGIITMLRCLHECKCRGLQHGENPWKAKPIKFCNQIY